MPPGFVGELVTAKAVESMFRSDGPDITRLAWTRTVLPSLLSRLDPATSSTRLMSSAAVRPWYSTGVRGDVTRSPWNGPSIAAAAQPDDVISSAQLQNSVAVPVRGRVIVHEKWRLWHRSCGAVSERRRSRAILRRGSNPARPRRFSRPLRRSVARHLAGGDRAGPGSAGGSCGRGPNTVGP